MARPALAKMARALPGWLAVMVAITPFFSGVAAREADGSAEGIEFFEKRIRPLFHQACFECHAKGSDSKGGLQLDSRAVLLEGGYRGPAIDLKSPEASLLIAAVRHEGELKMPPKQRLSDGQIDDLKRWIAMGAPWPEGDNPTGGPAPALWSLRPVDDPPVPAADDAGWAKSPIDRFVWAKLTEHGLKPAAPADKATLLRRLTFDLVGLPPSEEEIRDFLADESADAIAHVVDRLLASPQYGERWARHWMDLVRFAETNGYEKNRDKPNAWRYRDYCIEAFNSDVPYDQFVREQLAGDLIENPRLSADGRFVMSPIGSGGLWFQEIIDFVVDWPQAHAEEMENQLEVFGKSLLGLSISCARCHDHKFDPIKAADYYSLAGVLASSTDVQVCVDSPARQREAARAQEQLRQIDLREQELLNRASRSPQFRKHLLAEAERISKYLLASTQLLQSPESDKETQIQAVARRAGLESDRLNRWTIELANAGPSQDRIFRTWTRLSSCPDDVFDYRKSAAACAAQAAARSLPKMEKPLFDFESDGYDGWTVAGQAFAGGPDHSGPWSVHGYSGRGFATSFAGSNAFTGKLLSPRFKIDRPNLVLAFLVAGGNHPEKTCVNLIVHSQVMHQSAGCSVTGDNSHQFQWRAIRLGPFLGRECSIELVDEEQGEWGHIMADHFCLLQLPPDPGEVTGLEDGTGDNQAIVDLLLDSGIRNRLDLANGYQRVIIDSLKEWHLDLEERLAACRQQSQEPEPIHFVRNPLNYSARDELLAWALRSNSLLADQGEIEQFLTAEEQSELAELRNERKKIESAVEPATLALVSAEARPHDLNIQIRGNAHRPGIETPRGYLEAVCGPDHARVAQGSGRRELADWMVSPNNPLTARVMVNRIWQHHFGQGIVRTVDDFGTRGSPPTHPELLDYLATRFIESGWSVKAMHRMMLLSNVYQQSSVGSPEANSTDPDNHWLSHMPIRRLEAECIRDAMLAVSGQLDSTLYGPSISMKPPSDERREYIPPDHLLAERSPRRTIYLEVRRGHIPGLLELFDFPKPYTCVGQRAISIVPLQSLNLMNDHFVVEQAKSWGNKIARSPKTSEERINEIFLRAFARRPREAELARAVAFLADQKGRHQAAADRDPELMSWIDLCHLTFNLSEFIFVR